MTGRQLYDVWFDCVCGQQHPARLEKPVPFLHPEAAAMSLAVFYDQNHRLPEGLESFLAEDFPCPNRQEIVSLPELDHFFFKATNVFTTFVSSG
jgi:hypothetical protein